MIASDVQKLEPGALVELYEVDAVLFGAERLLFHASTESGSIWWQGEEYMPWPIKAEGFERTSAQPPTPKLAVANLEGAISTLCQNFEDLVGAKLIRRRTFAKYLDARNFPEGNPTADPDEEMPPEVWYLERKSGETPAAVEWELASAMDLNGVKLPTRQIIANHCDWDYRSADCGYTGGPVATIDDQPTDSLALDRCSRKLTGCKLRFGENAELPFGGFPAASLVRM